MAADSTVTMGIGFGQKTFPSANKIFGLSRYEPVGVMISGDAAFMEIPWETIIKSYRARVGKTKHSTVMEWCQEFIAFLKRYGPIVGNEVQIRCFAQHLSIAYLRIIRDVDARVEQTLQSKRTPGRMSRPSIGTSEVKKIVSSVIGLHAHRWMTAKLGKAMDKRGPPSIRQTYRSTIMKIKREMFGKFQLSRSDSEHLTSIAGDVATRFLEEGDSEDGMRYFPSTEVVIAGFGEEEVFPSYVSCDVAGIMNGRLKFRELTYERIGFEERNGAGIQGFAQMEDVVNFMDGIHPRYRAQILAFVYHLLDEYPNVIVDSLERKTGKGMKRLRNQARRIGTEIGKAFVDEIRDFQVDNFSNPIMDIIMGLPKDELARVAENLVNLTSIRQRYTPGTETVGGPIDVAVISKGDGFVWINRKHYFDPAKNPQFIANSYNG